MLLIKCKASRKKKPERNSVSLYTISHCSGDINFYQSIQIRLTGHKINVIINNVTMLLVLKYSLRLCGELDGKSSLLINVRLLRFKTASGNEVIS